MQTINLNLGPRSYDIIAGSGVVAELAIRLKELAVGSDAYLISNAAVNKRCGGVVAEALKKGGFGVRVKLIPDTERSKSIGVAVGLIRDLAAYDRQRKVFVAALGGGVVGDCAGFVASIYKRGIPYIQIPTTLLAQVDSSIGGKTGVDLPEGKNLLGSFYQPRLVISDTDFISTLGPRQVRAGLAEVIKYAVIRDPRLFSFLESCSSDVLSLESAALEHIVVTCSRIKAAIVREDERETKGVRTVLNFGHTLGHAIEAASRYSSYNHGEAVALGMLVACDISEKLGLLSPQDNLRVGRLISRCGLPERIQGLSVDAVVNAHYRDKKFLGRRNRFVLIKTIGRAEIVLDVPLGIIRSAIRTRMRTT